jgi:hypothetical protein
MQKDCTQKTDLYSAILTALPTNTDSIIKKLFTVFAFVPAFKPRYYIKTNPDRGTTVNRITIPGLIINLLATLYRDTRIVYQALYLDCKNTRHASLITASEALSSDAGILLTASIRSATLSNYTAGPSDCLITCLFCL